MLPRVIGRRDEEGSAVGLDTLDTLKVQGGSSAYIIPCPLGQALRSSRLKPSAVTLYYADPAQQPLTTAGEELL